jgi:hypothetical protein
MNQTNFEMDDMLDLSASEDEDSVQSLGNVTYTQLVHVCERLSEFAQSYKDNATGLTTRR